MTAPPETNQHLLASVDVCLRLVRATIYACDPRNSDHEDEFVDVQSTARETAESLHGIVYGAMKESDFFNPFILSIKNKKATHSTNFALVLAAEEELGDMEGAGVLYEAGCVAKVAEHIDSVKAWMKTTRDESCKVLDG